MLREGLALAVAGVAIGLVGSLGPTRLMSSLLYGVSATDALVFTAVPAFLLAVAALACSVPARRAVSLEPVAALREE